MKTDAPRLVLVTQTNSINTNKALSVSGEGSEAAEEMSPRSRSGVRLDSRYASAPKRRIKIKSFGFPRGQLRREKLCCT